MILKRIIVNVGNIGGTNCYIVEDDETKETMVIDPGGEIQKIADMLTSLSANLKYIVLTHCHADHISGVNELKEKFGGKVLVHRDDEQGLHDKNINLAYAINAPDVEVYADSRLDDRDLIHLGNLEFEIIHTPGHTQGGICIYCAEKDLLFSGDTLFRGAWGRTDLPTSSFEKIIEAITNRIMILPNYTIVYPGHGKSTMISEEKPIYLELRPKIY